MGKTTREQTPITYIVRSMPPWMKKKAWHFPEYFETKEGALDYQQWLEYEQGIPAKIQRAVFGVGSGNAHNRLKTST